MNPMRVRTTAYCKAAPPSGWKEPERLIDPVKPFKVTIITACIRKLLTIVNVVMKAKHLGRVYWQLDAAAHPRIGKRSNARNDQVT